MPLSEPESNNPFGGDLLEYDVYQSQLRCLTEAIAQYREEPPRPLPKRVGRIHMLVYLGEMETHTMIEALNGMGLNGRVVWQESQKAFQRLHGKEEND